MKTLGENIKRVRLAKGIVQRRMAKDLGVCVQTILNIENGKCLNMDTIDRVLEYLGVGIVYKFWDKDKFCPRCGSPLLIELNETEDNYPYYCEICDENFFEAEALGSAKVML